MSEEFGGALPTAIFEEQQKLPPGFLEQIVEYRTYAWAHGLVTSATTSEATKALPRHPMVQLARLIEMENAKEDIKAEAKRAKRRKPRGRRG